MLYTIIIRMFNPKIAMNNNSINELSSKLRDLTVKCTRTQEALKEINQESARMEHIFWVARLIKRRRQRHQMLANTNTFQIDELVCIINKYRAIEEGVRWQVIYVAPYYIRLRNNTNGAIYKRHWRNISFINKKMAH